MNRRLLVLICLLFATVTLFAAEKLSVSSVQLGMSNDVWSNGLSRNDDDQDSFTLYSTVDTNYGWIRFDSHSITNRGWREGWKPGKKEVEGTGELYRGRYDQMEVMTGNEFSLFATENNDISVRLEAGATILGKLGLEFLQNGLHYVAGIHEVELPYDLKSPVIRPAFSVTTDYTRKLMHIGHGELSAKASLGVSGSVSLSYEENALASVMLSGPSGDYAFASLGYNWMQTKSGLPTQELLSEFETGPEFAFGFQAGAIHLDYKTNIVTDYGLTIISVDFMKILDMGARKANGREDIPNAYVAYSYTPQINYMVVGFKLPVEEYPDWKLIAIDRYTAGTPVSYKEEQYSDVFKDPRKKLNDAFMMAGLEHVFHFSFTDWFQPYTYGGVGLAFLRYDELRNMVDEYKEPSYSYHNIRPCMELGAGIQTRSIRIPYLSIIPPFEIFLAGGIVLTPGVTKVTPTGVDLGRMGILPYAQMGVSIDMDI